MSTHTEHALARRESQMPYWLEKLFEITWTEIRDELVAAGKVQVDGQDELRKSCKVRAGQVVAVHGARVRVAAARAVAD